MNNSVQEVSWIDAPWLKDHLEEVTILDVQPDIHDYILEHIPEQFTSTRTISGLFRTTFPPITFQYNAFSSFFNLLVYRKTKLL
jgi:hypothetical protein